MTTQLGFKVDLTGKAGEYTALGYKSADWIRSNGLTQPQGFSENYHLRFDAAVLRTQSQDFMRNNGIYQTVIDRALDAIVNDGFQLIALTGDKFLDEQLETLWYEWTQSNFEVRESQSFPEFEREVLRQVFVDGDLAILLLSNGQIQLIEADRIYSPIRNGNVINGVETSPLGKIEKIFVANYSPNGNLARGSSVAYSRQQFLFLAHTIRASQTRGIPPLASNFPNLHRLNDILNSECASFQIQSRHALTVNRESGPEQAYLESTDDTEKDNAYQIPARYVELDSAVIFHGLPGEKVESIKREIPGMNFDTASKFFIQTLALPLGVPLDVVMLDNSGQNYSSARATLGTAKRNFKRWQNFLINRLYNPLYRWKVNQWITEGKLQGDNPRLLNCDWRSSNIQWIDPLKETQARGEELDRGLVTQTEMLKGQGVDREDYLELRAKEIQEAIEKANEINNLYPGANVPWQIFAGIKQVNNMPAQNANPIKDDGEKNNEIVEDDSKQDQE